MTFKNAVKDGKIITVAVIALVGLAGAVGYQFDRPVWASEFKVLLQQVQQNQKNVRQIQIDSLQRRIWDQEDRLTFRPTRDGRIRLRELGSQMEVLKENR